MIFRTSEPRRIPFPKLGTLALALLLLSGCATFRRHEWYSGPAHLKEPTRAAINTAIAELSAELRRPMKWDWDKDRISVRVIPADGTAYGIPAIRNPFTGGMAWGWATGRRLTLPEGFRPSTLVHEVGHVVMSANGIRITDPDNHHRMAPRFFRKHNGRH